MQRFRRLPQFHSGFVIDAIDHKMVVPMIPVNVCSDQHLMTGPCARRELETDSVHLLRRDSFVRIERLDVVIEIRAAELSPRLLRRHELIEGVCGNTVHARRAEHVLYR